MGEAIHNIYDVIYEHKNEDTPFGNFCKILDNDETLKDSSVDRNEDMQYYYICKTYGAEYAEHIGLLATICVYDGKLDLPETKEPDTPLSIDNDFKIKFDIGVGLTGIKGKPIYRWGKEVGKITSYNDLNGYAGAEIFKEFADSFRDEIGLNPHIRISSIPIMKPDINVEVAKINGKTRYDNIDASAAAKYFSTNAEYDEWVMLNALRICRNDPRKPYSEAVNISLAQLEMDLNQKMYNGIRFTLEDLRIKSTQQLNNQQNEFVQRNISPNFI